MLNECLAGRKLSCFASLSSLLPLNVVLNTSFVIRCSTTFDRSLKKFDSRAYKRSLSKEQFPMCNLFNTALKQRIRFALTENQSCFTIFSNQIFQLMESMAVARHLISATTEFVA
ncbi:hypothetical protein M3Y95_00140200 [Aphelenchoides besseyi]|nr:hypothetical protein M3Y95_00140200 [Aphelenchoides besseyi]